MADNIEEYRQVIDQIDKDLHDLINKRAKIVEEIGAIKQKDGSPICHPQREAQLIRKVLSRGENILPEATLIQIWRELIGAFTLLQDPSLKVSVPHLPDHPREILKEHARDYFGVHFPALNASGARAALSMVREEHASFCVVPSPGEEVDA